MTTASEAAGAAAPMRARWLALSLVVHLALLLGYGVPALVAQHRARLAGEAAAAAERARADQARLAAEAARRTAREQAMRTVAARMHDDLSRQLDAAAAKRLDAQWDAIVHQLDGDLGRYADDLAATGRSDAELRDRLAALEASAAAAAADAADAADRARRIEDALAGAEAAVPGLAAAYRKELDAKVGDPLKASAAELAAKAGDLADAVRKALADLDAEGAAKVDDAFTKAFTEKASAALADAIVQSEAKPADGDAPDLDEATAALLRARLQELFDKLVPARVAAGDAVPHGEARAHDHLPLHDGTGGAAAGAGGGAPTTALDAYAAALAAATARAGDIGSGEAGGLAAMLAQIRNHGHGASADAHGDAAGSELKALARNLGDGRVLAGDRAGGIAGLRRMAGAPRGNRAGRGAGGLWFDADAHRALTDGIHERDAAAAQGEVVDPEAVAAAVSHADASTTIARSPVLVVPPEQDAAHATVAAAQPYRPRMKSIAFAAAPYAARGLVVDGDLSDWDGIPAIELHPTAGSAQVAGAPPAQRAQLAWDRGGLYVAATVADPDATVRRVAPANFWEGDGCEIWFDARNTKDRHRGSPWARQFWVWAAGSEADPDVVAGEAVVEDPNLGFTWRTFGTSDVQRAAKQTASGWNLEFYLPARLSAGLEMRPGRIVGFNVSVCTGTPAYYYWAGTSDVRTSDRPDTWGDLLLAGSDGRVEAFERAADAAPGETHPARAVVPGAPLALRVVDPDRDLDASASDRVEVVCTTGHGDQELVVLGETGPSTGVFEGSIATALAIGDDVAGTLSLYEGETVHVVYTDAARADGSRMVDVGLDLSVAAGATDAR